MNHIPIIRRLASALAALAGALLALSAAVPAALARPVPPLGGPRAAARPPRPLPPGWNKHPPLPAHAHTFASGGMSGWQITLIAAAALLLAATLAVTLYRARAARQRASVTAHPA
jgi:hypothetical protein